jgi:hypothetical protein
MFGYVIDAKKIKQKKIPNHMNEGKLNFISKSWNKKIKTKNMMCAQCEYIYIITKLWKKKQDHDKDMYPKLMLNKQKVMCNSTSIYTY